MADAPGVWVPVLAPGGAGFLPRPGWQLLSGHLLYRTSHLQAAAVHACLPTPQPRLLQLI